MVEAIGFVAGGGLLVTRQNGLGATCGQGARLRRASFASGSRRRSIVHNTTMTQQLSGRKTFEIQKPLGMILEELESGTVFVADVSADGNAILQGIKKGDLVIGIDDKLYAGKGLEAAMEAISSSESDAVKVLVERTVTVEGEKQIDDKLKNRLRSEISAPYRQNWIGIISVAVLTLIVLARFAGIR